MEFLKGKDASDNGGTDIVDFVKASRKGIEGCGAPHIHLNAAGASPMSKEVYETYIGVLGRERLVGGYVAAKEYASGFQKTRENIAKLLNAEFPNEIALVDSATTAWMRAFYCVKLEPGDIVLTSITEYAGNYVAMMQHTRRFGGEVKCLDSDTHGYVDLHKLEQFLNDFGSRVKALCITHVPTNGGIVNPVEKIGVIAKRHGVLYICDSCQGVGQLVVDVQRIGCDFLAATGRKFLRGPRGTGFLYARSKIMDEMDCGSSRVREPPTLDHFAAPVRISEAGVSYVLAKGARRFEQWESNFAGHVALGIAVQALLDIGIKYVQTRVVELAQLLRKQLCRIPTVTVTDLGVKGERCGIVTFSVDGIKAMDVKAYAEARSIYIHVSPSRSSPLDALSRNIPDTGLVRASVNYFNTKEDIDALLECMFAMVRLHRRNEEARGVISNVVIKNLEQTFVEKISKGRKILAQHSKEFAALEEPHERLRSVSYVSKSDLMVALQAELKSAALEVIEAQTFNEGSRSKLPSYRIPHALIAQSVRFTTAYTKLIELVVAPHLRSERLKTMSNSSRIERSLTLLYQYPPSLRHVPPSKEGSQGVFMAQLHSDDEFGHQPCELNFWFPLDEVDASTTLWIETEPFKGNWQPLLPPPNGGNDDTRGCFMGRFYGARCRHFSMKHSKASPRLSIDFRVCFKDEFEVSYELPGMAHRHERRELM